MGFNTAMIVRNDFLNDVERDANFGERVADAIRYAGYPNPPYHGQTFDVLPPQHADYNQIVKIGGNSISRFGAYAGVWDSSDVEVLKNLADSMGYRLVKKVDK